MAAAITPDSLLREYKMYGRTSWDIIAISASDSDQALGYEMLGREKFHDKLRVFFDAPGPKIGNGGALLQCLGELRDELSVQRLCQLRILFIPAGGMSQRSPWLSGLGKLFAVLPTTHGFLDMLDITVALTEPFARIATQGCVFLAASDVVLPYYLSDEELAAASLHFSDADFVALAHPTSDLALASGHGVYCVASDGLECRRVLQKPSIDLMRSVGAFLTGKGEEVLVDSDFWLSGRIVQMLLAWYDTNKFRVELCAYGDLLRALGPEAVLDYSDDTRNLSQPSPETIADLVQVRSKLFNLLRPCQLRLCRLERSALVHIGSTTEYLSQVFEPMPLASSFSGCLDRHQQGFSLICCKLSGVIHIEAGSALEFCHINLRSFSVGRSCLLSHCFCDAPQETLFIPDGWVVQTVPMRDGSHVTWALHASDNPKQRDAEAASFLNGRLKDFVRDHGISDSFYWSGSLWSAKIYPWDHQLNASQSLLITASALQGQVRLSDWLAASSHRCLLSLAEIATKKDTTALVNFRRSLQ